MKKIFTLSLFAVTLLVACEKRDQADESYQHSNHRVVAIPSDGKTESTMLLFTEIGHDAKTCNGCVLVEGQLIHINCMGDGHYCAYATAVQLQQIGATITATTTDTFDLTSEDFFLMPNRSLGFKDDKGNPVFLNIPGQMVYRDTATLQFTFTGLFYSTTAAYSNL
jgi:hypothetical protein